MDLNTITSVADGTPVAPYVSLLAKIIVFVVAYLLFSWIFKRVLAWLKKTLTAITGQTSNKLDDHIINSLFGFSGVLVRLIAFLLAAETISLNVNAFWGGLAASSIALAMAGRTFVANAVASIHILITRDFDVGDTIKIKGFAGTVRKVGILRTVLEPAEGGEICIPNKNFPENILER